MEAQKLPIPSSPGRISHSLNTTPPARYTKKWNRTSKPRVRTGCLTCKVRHVKCDETKPSCQRCTTTGRVCDGYPVAPPRKTDPEYAFLTFPTVASADNLRELRAFSHFRSHSAPILASFFDSQFWMRLVLQMSMADEAVRHAVIAFDTLSERMSLRNIAPPAGHPVIDQRNEDWRDDPFAMIHYNKAIECLTKRSDSASSVDVVMLVCVLFVCIEALRGEVDTATMHFNGGMKTALSRIPAARTEQGTNSTERLEHHVLPLLCRIELLSRHFGNRPPWPYPLDLSESVPREFTNVNAARDSIIHIMNIIMRFRQQVAPSKWRRSITQQDYARQAELHESLRDWSLKTNTMVEQTSMPHDDLLALQMLRMHHLIADIMLSRATEIEESACDSMLSEFETALALAENIAERKMRRDRQSSVESNVFLLDMELVSPTYLIAVKCRHPRVRRRAIALLRTLRRREGFFDSTLVAALAERLMNIEEANLTVLDGSEWPKERDRVHHTDIKTGMKPDGTKPKSTFFMKPDGLDAPWSTIQEVIGLPPEK